LEYGQKKQSQALRGYSSSFSRILIDIGIVGDPHHISSAIICTCPFSAV
jgi:hypothetical protein